MRAWSAEQLLDDRVGGLGVDEVDRIDVGAAAGGRDAVADLLELLGATGQQAHRGAALGHLPGRVRADAARRTRDDDGAAVEAHDCPSSKALPPSNAVSSRMQRCIIAAADSSG